MDADTANNWPAVISGLLGVLAGSAMTLVGGYLARSDERKAKHLNFHLDNYLALQDSLSEYAVLAGRWFTLQEEALRTTGTWTRGDDTQLSSQFSAAARTLTHHSSRCRSPEIRTEVGNLMQFLTDHINSLRSNLGSLSNLLDALEVTKGQWAGSYALLSEKIGKEIRTLVPRKMRFSQAH